MSFDWTEYLYLAREVAGQTVTPPASQEARLRCAVSRAYYAAFIRARNHLRYVDHDLHVPNDGSAHIYVKDRFTNDPDRRRRQIGVLLRNLKAARTKADYADSFPNLPASTTVSLNQAATIIHILDNL